MDANARKLESIEFAGKLFKVLRNAQLWQNTTEEERHQLAINKAGDFARAYPLVVAKMAREGLYNERAFSRFLDKMHANPGRGMAGIIAMQAEYARLLYIELERAAGRHFSAKIAGQIYQAEHKAMNHWLKKTEENERAARNEFESESIQHNREKAREFLDWFAQQKEKNPQAYQEIVDAKYNYDEPQPETQAEAEAEAEPEIVKNYSAAREQFLD